MQLLMKNIILSLMCVSAVQAANLAAAPSTILLDGYLPEGCYQTGLYEQQKSIAGMSKLLETQGSFAFACDKGLLWHTAAPLNETLVYSLQGNTQIVRADGSSQKLSGTVQRHLGQMLNNLIGGNRAYLEKTFAIVATDSGIRLTPRKKRMEKFLRAIDMTRSGDTVTIRMQHQGDEFTAIRVYQLQALQKLGREECMQINKTNERSITAACLQLSTP